MSGDGSDWNLNQLLFQMIKHWWQIHERLRQLTKKIPRMCERRKFSVNMSRSKVMKYIRMVDDGIMNVALNGKLLEEVELFKYLVSYIEI